MSITDNIIQVAERISLVTGRLLSWLVYVMMILTCAIVVLRYGFQISIIALQESVTYAHALLFMLGAAYTLQQGEHVRVDIFYRAFSARRKALVDCMGTLLFLLPLCGYLLFSSADYVANSWAIRERSVETQGIPAVFILKSLIPAMAILLLVQGLAELARNLRILCADD